MGGGTGACAVGVEDPAGGTLHRAPVGQGPSGPGSGWPLPLGFGLDGRLLLAQRKRVSV